MRGPTGPEILVNKKRTMEFPQFLSHPSLPPLLWKFIFAEKYSQKMFFIAKFKIHFCCLLVSLFKCVSSKKSSSGRPWEGKGYPPPQKKNFFAYLHHLGHEQNKKNQVWKGMSHPPSCMEFPQLFFLLLIEPFPKSFRFIQYFKHLNIRIYCPAFGLVLKPKHLKP